MENTAQWIWHFADFELFHHMKLSLSRRERGSIVPTFWKIFDCHRLVRFEKTVYLEKGEYIKVTVDGVGTFMEGYRRRPIDKPIYLEPGEHHIAIVAGHADGIPAVLVEGDTVISDTSWTANALEGERAPVGGNLLPSGQTPTTFELPCNPVAVVSSWPTDSGLVCDFGRETYIKLGFSLPEPGCAVRVVYGESEAEVMSDEHAVIQEELPQASGSVLLPGAACRYVRIVSPIPPKDVYGLCEYRPLESRGTFHCSDPLIDRIYDTAEYTLRLNSRLFYLDGIKRDGWVWGGDAYQCFFFNYYCHQDPEIVQQTLLALRGGDPIVSHINTIMDYSLYWLMSLGDYALYTGDHTFIERVYDKAERLMAFCEARENEQGLLQGGEGDWTFIDWADMEKHGALCAMQMLYCRALQSMAKCSQTVGRQQSSRHYDEKAARLAALIPKLYWDAEQKAFVTTVDAGTKSTQVRRHANIFALVYGFADALMQEQIVRHVLLNDAIPAINTPYFKFFELEALCQAGRMEDVTECIRSYWGGMLAEGATTFWEEYDPNKTGTDHLAMYGQPFDKSLCHAWGASPLYLLGRYYLGVRPLRDGFAEFEVSPDRGGLERISGTVPIGSGSVTVLQEAGRTEITTDAAGGWFVQNGQRTPITPGQPNTFTHPS